jgi:hypothetical protein
MVIPQLTGLVLLVGIALARKTCMYVRKYCSFVYTSLFLYAACRMEVVMLMMLPRSMRWWAIARRTLRLYSARVSTIRCCQSPTCTGFLFRPDAFDRTPINFGTLNNVEVELLGNILFPQNITYVQQVVNASSANSYWITMKGNQVTFSGNPLNPFGGTINGFGQAWYEAAAKTLPLGGLVRVSPQIDFHG